jgi:hypothetical protein
VYVRESVVEKPQLKVTIVKQKIRELRKDVIGRACTPAKSLTHGFPRHGQLNPWRIISERGLGHLSGFDLVRTDKMVWIQIYGHRIPDFKPVFTHISDAAETSGFGKGCVLFPIPR